jgi:predicted nuclease of predicted toxin-antitoxin system
MKLILDAHLPASLAQYFPGHDVLHTSFLPEGNLTADHTINEISVLEDRALITKDSDFYYSFVASRKPKKGLLNSIQCVDIQYNRHDFCCKHARI